jgi:hypothetical protein
MIIGIIFRRDTTHTISGLREEEETEFGKRIADLLWSFRCPCTHVIFARYTIMQHAARTFSTFIQVHSCRSEDALAQKRCEINAEGRSYGSKKMAEKSLKTNRIWSQ